MDTVILQRANHLQTCAVADVRQPRIAMAAEVALQNPSISGSIEDRSPCFQFLNAGRRFLRVKLRHLPVVDILAAAHGVGEMNLPAVARVNGAESGGDSA